MMGGVDWGDPGSGGLVQVGGGVGGYVGRGDLGLKQQH